jgi:hypothetical protein
VATALRTSKSVAFGGEQTLAWRPPVVCDGDGNVFLVPVPTVDPRDLNGPPAQARYTKKPCDILRVSADGKETTLIKPDAVPAFANADLVTTTSIALDARGSLHALVSVTREESRNQYIVSFDSLGQHISHRRIDLDEILVHRFEVLGSGEFLLTGLRLGAGPRVAVMAGEGDSLRDLSVFEDDKSETAPAAMQNEDQARPPVASPAQRPAPPPASLPDRLARSGDGRFYLVPRGEDSKSVHAIEASGQSRFAFNLSPMAPNLRLVDLMAAGNRLSAVYYEERPESRAFFWLAVYDITLGERLAVYGPAPAIPICYKRTEGEDEFTLLKGANLVTVSR